MIGAPAQAGNRASKTLRCAQWKESEPEQQAVTSGTVSPGQLLAIFTNQLHVLRSQCRGGFDDCLAGHLKMPEYLHGMQGTSCLEVLTYHVEFLYGLLAVGMRAFLHFATSPNQKKGWCATSWERYCYGSMFVADSVV